MSGQRRVDVVRDLSAPADAMRLPPAREVADVARGAGEARAPDLMLAAAAALNLLLVLVLTPELGVEARP